MKTRAMLAVMVLSLSGNAFCQYAAAFSSYYSGKRYDFRITHEQLSSTPVWLERKLNPPLSARSAKEIAAVYLSDLFKNASTWTVGQIELHPIADRWVYLISFDPPPPPGYQEWESAPVKVVVLMDGLAVKASKSSWKPNLPVKKQARSE